MPFQAIADTGVFAAVPDSCSSGGGAAVLTVQDFGANGIIGIGTTATDCGVLLHDRRRLVGGDLLRLPVDRLRGDRSARAASAAAPFEQLPNPVAAFAVDNNGTIISLPAVPQRGVPR